MDNVTHSLAGALLAEAALVLAPGFRRRAASLRASPISAAVSEPSSAFRTAAYTTSVLSNNLPDFDFFYARALPRPLGYLLYHRGHTHTLPFVVPLALLALAIVRGLGRWRGWRLSRSEWLVVAALALAGPMAHIAMDASNNYGVHPFFPFDDRWFYGDFVFIVEPWFWVAAIPPLLFAARSRTARGLLAAALCLIVALAFFVRVVPLALAFALAFGAAAALAIARRLSAGGRVVFGWCSSWMVAAFLFGMGRHARAEARAIAARDFPEAETHDMILTPMPANPFCWEMLLVQTERRGYRVRRGALATVPKWIGARACRIEWDDSHPTARYVPLPLADTDRVRWLGEYETGATAFATLAARDCRAAALLRFARAPYVASLAEPPGAVVMGDLRYDRSVGLDFSDVLLGDRGPPCPRAVPPWRPPRSELLAPTLLDR